MDTATGDPGDLGRLERRVRDVPESLEEFGPDYAIELDPAAHRVEGSWIRDATLGANDGLVSVLTLISGVAGAAKGNVVLIAGVSALVAGAISMGLGGFVSARAYRAYFLKELQRELREMRRQLQQLVEKAKTLPTPLPGTFCHIIEGPGLPTSKKAASLL